MQEGCLEIAKNGTCARWVGDNYLYWLKPGFTPATASTFDDLKNLNMFYDWRIWVSSVIYTVYCGISVVFVVIFAPKIFKWVADTPIR